MVQLAFPCLGNDILDGAGCQPQEIGRKNQDLKKERRHTEGKRGRRGPNRVVEYKGRNRNIKKKIIVDKKDSKKPSLICLLFLDLLLLLLLLLLLSQHVNGC
jgi:hypothetical protein